MESVVEVVIFDVKKNRQEDWKKSMKQWVEFIEKQPGFISHKYIQSMDNPRNYVQILEFQDKPKAQKILEDYKLKVGEHDFEVFFSLLNKKPIIEYYNKVEF